MKDESNQPELREIFRDDEKRIIVVINAEKTHLHEGVEAYIERAFKASHHLEFTPDVNGAIFMELEIEEKLPCYCIETTKSANVRMGIRGNREYASPIAVDSNPELSNRVTIILKPEVTITPAAQGGNQVFRIATAYIGSTAPLEPNHPSIKNKTASAAVIQESLDFWFNKDGTWKHAMVPEKGEDLVFVV